MIGFKRGVLYYIAAGSACEVLPQTVVGYGGLHADGFLRYRMNKFYAAREQRDASVGIAAWRSVLQVALYGAAHVGKLAAYLVMTTGEESHLKEHIVVRLGTQTVFQDCFLAPGRSLS